MSVMEGRERRMSIGAQRNPASQEAILQAAEEILAEGGPGAFSIEAVAKRAKAGKPTIYRWWPSKAALLLDVYHRQKNVVAAPDTGTIEEDVFTFLSSLLSYWRESSAGAVFRSVIAEAQTDAAAAEALAAYAQERWKHSGEMFRRAQVRGEVASWIDPELATETISSFAWNRLLTGRLELRPEELRLFVRQLTQGMLAKDVQ